MIFLLSILAPCTLVAICQQEFITRIYGYGMFHAFYFRVQQFSVLHFHVLHFHVLHFHPCDFDGLSFSRPALSVAPFTQTALKLFLLLSYFCGPDQSFWLRP